MPFGIGKLLKRVAPGNRADEAELLQSGSLVKSYTVERRLGSGQFAIVSSGPVGSHGTRAGHFRGPFSGWKHAQIGSRECRAALAGSGLQEPVAAAAARRRRPAAAGAASMLTYRSRPPPVQVYKVQAPDGGVYALKQERFGDMSHADRWAMSCRECTCPCKNRCRRCGVEPLVCRQLTATGAALDDLSGWRR